MTHYQWPPPNPFILYQGRTSAAGNAGGTTVVDTALPATARIEAGQVLVIYTDDPTQVAARELLSFAAGTFTVSRAFAAQIPAGVEYAVLAMLTPDERIGYNNANNAYDSTLVTANADGSVFERLEWIQAAVLALQNAGELFTTFGPAEVEIDNQAVFGLNLYDPGGIIPVAANIVPGTVNVDRIRAGAAAANIVAGAAAVAADGRITYAYQPTAAGGWQEGDLIIVIFNGDASFTIGAVTTNIPMVRMWCRIVRDLVPAADAVTNADTGDVVGNKADTALYAAAATASLMRYVKGLLGALVEATGTADAGSDADTLVDAALTQANDYWNGMVLLMLTGNNAGLSRPITDFVAATDSAEIRPAFPNAIAAGDVYVILSIPAELVPPTDSVNNDRPADIIGSKADTASEDPDVDNVSLMRLVKALMRTWKAVIPNIDVALAAIDNVLTTSPAVGAPDAENTIMDLAITAGTMYKLEDLVLKVSGFGAGTQITIQLWELLNGNVRASYVNTASAIIDTPGDHPWTEYQNLMDLFGKPSIVGDGIAITAINNAPGAPGALSCTYTYSTARTS